MEQTSFLLKIIEEKKIKKEKQGDEKEKNKSKKVGTESTRKRIIKINVECRWGKNF